MPFLDELIVRVAGSHYILSRPLRYRAANGGEITVPKGFQTDFASIPRVFRAVFTGHDRTRKAAVIHDYLYRNKSGTRKAADDLFLAAMGESGVPMWKRYSMYWAVRAGGWVHWRSRK